jgi:hypothetical protein
MTVKTVWLYLLSNPPYVTINRPHRFGTIALSAIVFADVNIYMGLQS